MSALVALAPAAHAAGTGTITGTVSPAGVPGLEVEVCPADGDGSMCIMTTPAAGGSYSVDVTPGQNYVVTAHASDYLQTYLGGCVMDSGTCVPGTSTDVTVVPGPAAGTSTAVGVITLTRSATISGVITPPAVYAAAANTQVIWSQLTTDGSGAVVLGNGGGVSLSAGTGAYTTLGLLPDTDYVVWAVADGYLPSWLGGYVGANPDFTASPPPVTIIHTPAAGGDVPGQNITLVPGATIQGTITPTIPFDPAGGTIVTISLCPVTSTDTTTALPWGPDCVLASAYPASGNPPMTYSATVTPGVTYVVTAWTDGYLYSYRGGFASNDFTNQLPNAKITPVVAPAAGQVLTGQDIAMAKEATITGQVTPPAGYTFDPAGPGWVYAYAVEPASDTGKPTVTETFLSGQILSDGTYTIDHLVPGTQVVVCASPQTLPASYQLVTCHGGYADLGAPVGRDTSTPGLTTVTAPATGVDISAVAPVTVTGTVYQPDGKTPFVPAPGQYAAVSLVYFDAGGNKVMASLGGFGSDGTYSIAGAPGVSYMVEAEVQGYVAAWLGGYYGEKPDLPNAKVTQLPAMAPGQTTANQNITLNPGSSITGTVTYTPVAPDLAAAWVVACQSHPDGSLSDCASTTLDGPGTYRLDGLLPGVPYVVFGEALGHSLTYYGGRVGSVALPHAGVTPVTTAAPGGVVPNIDITLSKRVTLTGTVLPAPVVSAASAVKVYACPTYADGGASYYANQFLGAGPKSTQEPVAATATPTNPLVDAMAYCIESWADTATGTYSMEADAGQQYVLIAQYFGTGTGYVDAWYGGLIAASGLHPNGNGAVWAPLPTGQVTLVSGTAGQTVAGLNITFGKAVLVTFDAAGGTPATQVRSVAPGGVTVLPTAPTRAGYDFGGWYTDKDGAGTQFTATTPVTEALTVYAKWTPSHVSPGGGTSVPSTGGSAVALLVAVAVAGVVSGTVLLRRRRG